MLVLKDIQWNNGAAKDIYTTSGFISLLLASTRFNSSWECECVPALQKL